MTHLIQLEQTAIQFQPTLPVREVTIKCQSFYYQKIISTHTSREGSDFVTYDELTGQNISTHTSREGSDIRITSGQNSSIYFNPHFP